MFMVYPFIPRFYPFLTHTKQQKNIQNNFITVFSNRFSHQTPSITSSKRLQQFFRYLLPCWAQELNQIMGVSCPKTGPATGSQTGSCFLELQDAIGANTSDTVWTYLDPVPLINLCSFMCNTVLISLNLKCQVFWRRWNRMPYVHRFLLLSACRIHLLVQGRRWPSQTTDFWDAPLGSQVTELLGSGGGTSKA